jgi:EpsI family protein
MRFLNGKYAVWLTVLLVIQGGAYYAVASRPELTPPVTPLAAFPPEISGWRTIRDIPIDAEIQEVLKADDILNREYLSPAANSAVFFYIAYFKTQRTGATPHSPKNCLPGSGFEPVETPATISIAVPGRAAPLVANQYVVARGEDKMVVLYWYQSHSRIIANEFAAKFWLIADAIRYRRSDTAVVKVQVPVRGSDNAAGIKLAAEFVQAVYPALANQLPL